MLAQPSQAHGRRFALERAYHRGGAEGAGLNSLVYHPLRDAPPTYLPGKLATLQQLSHAPARVRKTFAARWLGVPKDEDAAGGYYTPLRTKRPEPR